MRWICFAACTTAAMADVRLPAIFSDHMVLQRGAELPVWGWADPGENVAVSLTGAAGYEAKTTRAGADGRWIVRLLSPGGSSGASNTPLGLVVEGKNTIRIDDVLLGEVWLCSGQSNMAMKVSAAQNFEQEKAAANLPQIRTFLVERASARTPQADVKGRWVAAAPETVGDFSAAAYFFARTVYKKLRAPVGLINSSVGGTAIELWISAEAQRNSPDLKAAMAELDKANREFDAAAATAKYEAALERWKMASAEARAKGEPRPRPPQDPVAAQERKTGIGVLFNGMIAPLIPYAVRGALWYQGEANSTPARARFYQYQLPLLIKDWRARWGQRVFPFAWVQLPNFDGPGRNWPLVREAMLKTLALPDTGMAITIDIGEADNIHPKNKQEAGKRLGMWALGAVYWEPVASSGPLPAGHEIQREKIIVKFTHTDGGLTAKEGALKGFEIAGADRHWVAATAVISGSAVMVSTPEIKQPAAVRYAWTNNPVCNLYNGAGIPATPFRTDDWDEH
jgi:sialate O-acetylesterase